MVAIKFTAFKKKIKCFDGISYGVEVLLDEVGFFVASCSSFLPQFQDFFISSIIRSWQKWHSLPRFLLLLCRFNYPLLRVALSNSILTGVMGNPGSPGIGVIICDSEIILSFLGPVGLVSVN